MTDIITRAKAALEGTTEGPWAWFGNNYSLYLATTHSGRRHVMGFDRMGMQGAQPTFNDDMQIKPASDLVRFVVGDGNAKGFKDGREDASVYRYDISGIDHPDARLIAAAPDLIRDLVAEVERLRAAVDKMNCTTPIANILQEEDIPSELFGRLAGVLKDQHDALDELKGDDNE